METVIVENTWSGNAEENIAGGQNEARNHAASFSPNLISKYCGLIKAVRSLDF